MFLEFLTDLYDSGISYSAINTARSAISSIVICNTKGHTLGANSLVSRFMKGIYELRPSIPRYKTIWDASIVLRFLTTLSPVKFISLKKLSYKTIMLIALVTACRADTLFQLNIDNMITKKSSFIFNVKMKQSRRGYTTPQIQLDVYPVDRRLCVYTVLKEYLLRTKCLRKSSQLFISYIKPYDPITKSTISRWIKDVLKLSGVDTTIFKPHSVRSASVSKASRADVPIDTVLEAVGWSNETTFQKYYNKPCLQNAASQFGEAVLKMVK